MMTAMEIRNYTNLHAFNRVGMTEFWMHSIEYDQSGPFQNLVFIAGRGYMEYFGAKIKFIGMEYIASAFFYPLYFASSVLAGIACSWRISRM